MDRAKRFGIGSGRSSVGSPPLGGKTPKYRFAVTVIDMAMRA